MPKGPMPKHPDKRQRRNKNQPQPVEIVAHESLLTDPPAPSEFWLEEVAAEWDGFWRSDLAQVIAETDVDALWRLFQLRDDWRRCAVEAARQPFVEGSRGQPTENPLAKRADRLLGQIASLEDRFGLTPASRARLGITAMDLQDRHKRTTNTYQDLIGDVK